MARINIVTNINSAIGLKRDYDLLQSILLSAGHQVYGVQFNAPGNVNHVDVNIFMETVVPNLFQCGTKNWLIPNPEWYQTQFYSQLRGFDKVLCKTWDAVNLFRNLARQYQATMPIQFIGWESKDFFDDTIPRERKFLHVAGNSSMKNTSAILEAWATGKMQCPLTVVSQVYACHSQVPNVRFYPTVREEEMKQLLNSHMFNLCTSHYEGFGHALHEAMSVGAAILATSRPPMDEFHAAVRVGSDGPRVQCLAQTWMVSGEQLLCGAKQLEAMSAEDINKYFSESRISFLSGREEFRRLIQEVISELPS